MKEFLKNIKHITICVFLATLFLFNTSHATDAVIKLEKTTIEASAKPTNKAETNNATSKEYDQEQIKKTIDDASIDAKKNAKDAQKSIIEASIEAKKSDSDQLTKLAKNKVAIEKSRKEIAKLQLLVANDLKRTMKDLDNISNSLKLIEAKYVQKYSSKHKLEEIYQEITIHWRVLADNSLKVFSQKSYIEIEKHNPVNLAYKIPKKITNHKILDQLEESYELLKIEYANLLTLKRDLKIANKNYQSNLLLQSGELRANILQKLLSMDEDFITYDNNYAQDLVRELKLIPYQPILVFYSKILQYRQTMDSGFTGLLYILKQIGLLGLLILIIAVSKKTLLRLTSLFNSLNQFCIKKSIIDRNYIRPAILLSKISSYFKWIMLILIFFLANIVIENTLFSELGVLIPYFQYYFLYKIFAIFTRHNLANLLHKHIYQQNKRGFFGAKIKKTTKLLGFYLLWSVYVIHLTQAIVDRAYFYNLTFDIFWIGLIIILAIASSEWRDEIKDVVKNKLSKKITKIINKLLSNKKSALLFCLPILTFLVIGSLIYKITNLLRNYDFFKNLLSQIYRKKLESAAKKVDQNDESAIDKSYLKEFSKVNQNDKFISIKDHPSDKFKAIIDSWQSGESEENSIAIHSEKGIGKSRFIEKITKENGEFKILQTKFNEKITDKNELLKIISELFQEKATERSLFKFLSSHKEKTIIILDDCHNLFLAKEGGFKALKLLFNLLVKIDNPNLLWIATFNSYSWNYLENSLKINNYFRHILRLPRWSDENIRELIISKHNKTSFELVYDPLIFAISVNKSEKEFEDLQQKFFQIIWSQSRGNPTIAISLWISSLCKEGKKSVKISLPKITKSSQLNNLTDDHLFVYGAIVKHQNLSVTQISAILSMSQEEVFNIIRIGLEKEYLEESPLDKKRFTTSSQWQTPINQLLINRNFIYAE